jgi:uncharacterized membrane protein YdjX (TVP38/TMEM64 family)
VTSWRRVGLWIWILGAVATLVVVATHPSAFTPQRLAGLLGQHQSWFLLLFLVLSVARAFVLLPATPLVLAGALVFPDRPWTVLGISLVSIALASTLIYCFADWIGVRAQVDRAAPRQIAAIERGVRHPLGAVFVAAWAFFPAVPTDLVCGVAGTVRMPFATFLSAVLVGEGVLCALYVFGGRAAVDLIGGLAR